MYAISGTIVKIQGWHLRKVYATVVIIVARMVLNNQTHLMVNVLVGIIALKGAIVRYIALEDRIQTRHGMVTWLTVSRAALVNIVILLLVKCKKETVMLDLFV